MENLEGEIWKDIPNYEGYYQVSNKGRVKSLERVVKRKNTGDLPVKEKIRKQKTRIDGYFSVVLWKECKSKHIRVHQLVAITFLGHTQNKYSKVVNHKDFNSQNNNVENLEVTSQRKNANKKHIPHSSQYTGVSLNAETQKWHSYIFINGKNKYLGRFDKEYYAHLAYIKELNEFSKSL